LYICLINKQQNMITFDPSKCKVVSGDFLPSTEFVNEIFDGDGSSVSYAQFLEIESEGFQIEVIYDLYLSGRVYRDRGDYWTPSSIEVDVKSVDVEISSITIDGYDVELTEDLVKIFNNVIKNII
jgi:hypothetical protein